jgi:cytochrome c553
MRNRLIRIGAVVAGLVVGGALALARRLPSGRHATASVDNPVQEKRAVKKRQIVRIAKLFFVFLGVLAFGGFLVAASGIIPVKASSGHWKITEWFLHFSKKRSVATHTLGMKAPKLDAQELVLKGAGHYEIGCRPCHGSPELQTPRIARRMTPFPPYLPQTVPGWKDAELFYIVKHGIKFTGMPAWPAAGRDDEVWAMVAFLRKFPELKAEEYRQLVNDEIVSSGEAEPIQGLTEAGDSLRPLIESCARCHGVKGLGRKQGAFPKLAGQKPTYFERSLQAYARGQRHSGIMGPVAATLSQQEMSELAHYYSRLPGEVSFSSQDASAVERGKVIAQQGILSHRVPACAACHGPGVAPRNLAYPELAGQYAPYLVLQLEIFKQEFRGGTDYAHIMRQVAAGLSAEQMRDAALYYASLVSSTTPGGLEPGK